MRDPSGLKAADCTKLSWPRRTAISVVALAASQMRVVPSNDAVTMRDPSGLKAAEHTALSWPCRTAISLALAASQMRAVLSDDAVTMRDPSWLKAAEFTAPTWPPRAKRHFACERAATSAAAAGETLVLSVGSARSMRVPSRRDRQAGCVRVPVGDRRAAACRHVYHSVPSRSWLGRSPHASATFPDLRQSIPAATARYGSAPHGQPRPSAAVHGPNPSPRAVFAGRRIAPRSSVAPGQRASPQRDGSVRFTVVGDVSVIVELALHCRSC